MSFFLFIFLRIHRDFLSLRTGIFALFWSHLRHYLEEHFCFLLFLFRNMRILSTFSYSSFPWLCTASWVISSHLFFSSLSSSSLVSNLLLTPPPLHRKSIYETMIWKYTNPHKFCIKDVPCSFMWNRKEKTKYLSVGKWFNKL